MNRFSDFFLLFLLPSLIFTQITPTTAPIVSILNYKLNAVTNSQYSDVTLAGSLVSAVRPLQILILQLSLYNKPFTESLISS
jgi:hypothetical protein